MDIPANFPYKRAFLAGRPVHNQDDFSRKHPKMARGHRAKIFAPFAALDGFGGQIKTKDVVYIPPVELGEDEKRELNRKICFLADVTSSGKHIHESQIEVTAEYYVPCSDPYHDAYGVAGTYETTTGLCWRVDDVYKRLYIGDTMIRFDNLRRLESPSFEEEEE